MKNVNNMKRCDDKYNTSSKVWSPCCFICMVSYFKTSFNLYNHIRELFVNVLAATVVDRWFELE